MMALIIAFTSWIREVIDFKLADDHRNAAHFYARRIQRVLAAQRGNMMQQMTLAERMEFGNEIAKESHNLKDLVNAHLALQSYYEQRALARIGPCDDCSHCGRRQQLDDHHGGTKWVCPDRIECHARRPG